MTELNNSILTAADGERLLVVHFDEVALKGGRRRMFVRRLLENIRESSPRLVRGAPLRSLYDRILLGPLSQEQLVAARAVLPLLPGVSWFSEVVRLPPVPDSLPQIAEAVSLENGRCSFAVRTKRSKKDFPLNSLEIEREVGRLVQQRTGWPVDLENPDLTIRLDVTPQGILAYARKQRGPGGLPVGSTGKLVCLLSGGIDSPVAAWKMMGRGCRVVFVHFHNYGPHSPNVRRKLIALGEQLSRFQGTSRLYLVPFAEVQSELVAAVPPRMRMVAYRRAMLRLATPILEAEKAGGFVVGDSIGQVASQTLENLQATWPAAKYPVLAPLIGDNKRTIMELAKQIGTYDISILPYDDCCQLLLARSPETRCDREQMAAFEERLHLDRHCAEIGDQTEVLDLTGTGGAIVSRLAGKESG